MAAVLLKLGAPFARARETVTSRSCALRFCRWSLSVAGPVLADSDLPDVANGTGDDPTQPLGKIELLDRYTEAPGPGVEEGTTKRVETNTPVRPDRGAVQAHAAMGIELPSRNSGGVDKRSDARRIQPARPSPASATCWVRRGSCTTSINAGQSRSAGN